MSTVVHQVDGELDGERLALIAELVTGKSHEQAGAAVGVSAKTVSRRKREPAFAEALTEARRDHLDTVARRAASHALDAVDELHRLATTDESSTVRLNASRTLVQLVPDLIRHVDIEPRLRELEERASRRAAA
jgi:hypothetical protein